MRCEEPCGKVIYTTEIKAKLACVKAALEGDSSLTWYRSKVCKKWHVTNSDKRGNSGKRTDMVKGFERGGCAAGRGHEHERVAA